MRTGLRIWSRGHLACGTGRTSGTGIVFLTGSRRTELELRKLPAASTSTTLVERSTSVAAVKICARGFRDGNAPPSRSTAIICAGPALLRRTAVTTTSRRTPVIPGTRFAHAERPGTNTVIARSWPRAASAAVTTAALQDALSAATSAAQTTSQEEQTAR